MTAFNLRYAWLAARLSLDHLSSPVVEFGGVKFMVERQHYQLRRVLKDLAVEPVLASLLSLCDQQTLFIDIGANVGLFALLIASRTGAKVMAFEPVRSTFSSLVRNCSLNSHLDVAPLNLALGGGVGHVPITALPGSGINHVLPVYDQQDGPIQWAPQLRLDSLSIQDFISSGQKVVVKNICGAL